MVCKWNKSPLTKCSDSKKMTRSIYSNVFPPEGVTRANNLCILRAFDTFCSWSDRDNYLNRSTQHKKNEQLHVEVLKTTLQNLIFESNCEVGSSEFSPNGKLSTTS